MMRTQIQLPEEDYRRLKEIAARQGRSMADCIREGVSLFLQRLKAEEEDWEAIAGRFRPVPMDDLKDHDRHWAEASDPEAEQ